MSDVPRLTGLQQLAGRRLRNRYRLEALIGSGGMAHVWDATDEVLERRVAVKILHDHLQSDQTFVARFRAEGVAAARLTHRAIVSIYDQISEPDLEAIVMERIDGATMREWLTNNPVPPIEDACAVVATVAEALEAAHRMDLIHRDIKPSNILLSADGRVIVADFGIAKLSTDPDLTATGAMMGTARYLSPEQVRGEDLDGRSDVYSLAVVLYESLCGQVPFDANNDMATALARLQGPPVAPSQINTAIPPAVEAVVLRGLAERREDRFADATDFRNALLSALRAPAGPVPAAAVDHHEAVPSFAESERNWLVPTLVLLFIVVGLGVAALLLSATDAGQDLLDNARDVVDRSVGNDEPDVPPTETTPVQPVIDTNANTIALAAATSFDPQGSGNPPAEREDLVANAIDNDPATLWQTEGYVTRTFGNLKDGVGIIVQLERPTQIHELVVASPTVGWAAEIYTAAEPQAALADWGDARSTATSIDGDLRATDLEGEVGAVLVWITDLGEGSARVRVQIADIVLLGPSS